MARYEVSTDRLSEAGDIIISFADDLSGMRERFDGVLLELPDVLNSFNIHKKISGDILDISVLSKGLGRTLKEIADVYCQAEQSAFGAGDCAILEQRPQPQIAPAMQPPAIRQTQSVFLFGDLIMPDWLQAAVLRYEQARSAR